MKFFSGAFFLFYFLFAGCLTFAQEKISLKHALETAKNNNPELKSERLEVEYAKTEIISAKTRPNISFTTEIVQITNPSDFEDPSGRYRGGNREELWEVSKLIQTPAQRRHKIEYASRNLDYEQQHYLEIENELLTEVAIKWIETLSSQNQLEAYEQVNHEIAQIAGTTSRNSKNPDREFLQIEFLKTQLNLQYRTAQLEIKKNLNELNLLLNIDSPIDIDSSDDLIVDIPDNLPELVQLALKNRNDVKAAQFFTDVSESNVAFQKAMAIPQPEFGLIYNPKNNITHIGFSAIFDLPFFDRNQAERQKAKIQKAHAEQELFSLQSKIKNEITTSYDIYLLHHQNIKDVQLLKKHSETFLGYAKENFKNKETTPLEFMEEIQEWLEIQLLYAEVKEGFHENYIMLLNKIGLLQNLLD